MAELNKGIIIFPDERLRKISTPVTDLGSETRKFTEQLAIAMYRARGIGLAAPQVGRHERMIVVDITPVDEESKTGLIKMVNPVIVEVEGARTGVEGCLSFPEVTEEVRRSEKVFVKGLDVDGKEISIEAFGILAVVLQHEIDHLEGRLLVDHLSTIKKHIIRRKMIKLKRQIEEEG